MIDVGSCVEVVSYKYTNFHSGRKSQYNIGDIFQVKRIDGNTLCDDDYNFVNIKDVVLKTV